MGCIGREEDGKQNCKLRIVLKHSLKAAFIDFQPIGGNVKNSNYIFVVYLTVRAPQCVFIFVSVLLAMPICPMLYLAEHISGCFFFFSGGKYCYILLNWYGSKEQGWGLGVVCGACFSVGS